MQNTMGVALFIWMTEHRTNTVFVSGVAQRLKRNGREKAEWKSNDDKVSPSARSSPFSLPGNVTHSGTFLPASEVLFSEAVFQNTLDFLISPTSFHWESYTQMFYTRAHTQTHQLKENTRQIAIW